MVTKPFFTPLMALALVFNIGSTGYAAQAATKSNKAEVKGSSLRRADFRVVGTSCPACIMRVEGKIKAVPGVVKAAISIYKPYAGMIIYTPGKTNLQKIFASVKGETVKYEDRSEESISKIPAVLVPKLMKQAQSQPLAQPKTSTN